MFSSSLKRLGSFKACVNPIFLSSSLSCLFEQRTAIGSTNVIGGKFKISLLRHSPATISISSSNDNFATVTNNGAVKF